jgi:sulfate transport system substrate-binding protein
MLFLVRNGNPKGIKDWDDLVKPGVQVIVVNPKTGGNGRMAYLAAWGYVRKKGGTDAQAAEFVGKLYKNVPVLAKGGRDATTIFLQRNIGDVLVTFESEVISVDREFGTGKVDAIHPSISIIAENPVAVVERTVAKKGTGELAKAYLDYLYSDEAQEIAAKHALRPRSAAILKKYASHLQAADAGAGVRVLRFAGRSTKGALQRRWPVRQALYRQINDCGNLVLAAGRQRRSPAKATCAPRAARL